MLDATSSPTVSERSTRKEPLTDSEARKLLGQARRVLIARGRSHSELPASEVGLEQLKGPTGNFRAPMLLVGRTLVVGFNAEVLADLLTD